MAKSRAWRTVVFSDLGMLILLALAKLVLHTLTNGQYGWHRDELDILDNARYLAWGYVSYPPVTPFIARMGLVLDGPSLVGLRFFSALAMSSVMVLAGLMTRELSGSRWRLGIGAVIGNGRSDLATAALPVAPINSPWRDVVGGINSFCLRGYGDPPPHALIVPGSSQ